MTKYILIPIAVLIAILLVAAYAFAGRTKPADHNSNWEDIGGGYVQPTQSRSITAPNLQDSDDVEITGQMTPTWFAKHADKFVVVNGSAYTMLPADANGGVLIVTSDHDINMYNATKGSTFKVINRSGATISLQPSETGTADRLWFNGTDTSADGDEIDAAAATVVECISTADNVWECDCIGTCSDGGAT
jgi:hypothetical protein